MRSPRLNAFLLLTATCALVAHSGTTRAADLYLLADIDVPWVADGEQRDRGDRREEMQALFRDALVSRGLRFVEVSGSHEGRLSAAATAIDVLIEGD